MESSRKRLAETGGAAAASALRKGVERLWAHAAVELVGNLDDARAFVPHLQSILEACVQTVRELEMESAPESAGLERRLALCLSLVAVWREGGAMALARAHVFGPS